jgi:hypothetical protein
MGLQTKMELNLKTLGKGLKDISFPRIPNVGEFKIRINIYNPLLLAYGIIGKYKPELEITPYTNARAQRYMLYMQYLLTSKLDNPSFYWRISNHMIKRSKVYLVACLFNIDKNFYRELTAKRLRNLIREVDVLRGRRDGIYRHDLDMTRVYVPKVWGSELWRGLGVPTKAWRIYLNMLLHPLVLWTVINPEQHGFIPGKGTLTAIGEMLTKTIKADYIYEIDLKACFPSISLPRLKHRMTVKCSIPEYMAEFYVGLNYALPKVEGIMKEHDNNLLAQYESIWHNKEKQFLRPLTYFAGVPQQDIISMNQAHTWQYRGPSGKYSPVYIPDTADERLEQMTGINGETLVAFARSLEPLKIYAKSVLTDEIHRALQSRYDVGWMIPNNAPMVRDRLNPKGVHEFLKHIGTVMGSSLSPFLANIALAEMKELLPPGVGILQYADDAILYGDKQLEKYVNDGKFKSDLQSIGLLLNTKKSGWVKTGNWLADLKFLGVKYSGETDKLEASTRKGSTLSFTKRWLLHAEYDILRILGKTRTELLQEYRMYTRLKRAKLFLEEYIVYYLGSVRYDIHKSKLAEMLGAFTMTQIRLKDLLSSVDFPDKRFLLDLQVLLGLFFTLNTMEAIEWTKSYIRGTKSYNIVAGITRFFYDEQGSLKDLWKGNELEPKAQAEGWSRYLNANHGNPYINHYRDRYTWNNFLKSRLSGLLLSRLYQGSWNLENLEQDFTFTSVPRSLGSYLKTEDKGLTVFTGSSVAFKVILDSLSRPRKGHYSVRQIKALTSGSKAGTLLEELF